MFSITYFFQVMYHLYYLKDILHKNIWKSLHFFQIRKELICMTMIKIRRFIFLFLSCFTVEELFDLKMTFSEYPRGVLNFF